MPTRSGRHDGTRISLPSTGISRRRRYSTMSASEMSVPSRALMRSGSSSMVRGSGMSLSTSMTPSMTSPAPSSSTSSQARSTAGSVSSGSMFFSNLPEASVRMPRARAVWRMDVPLKFADSKTTSTVSPMISLFSPPMMPARPMGFVSSAITSMPGVRVRTLPSSVVRVSPGSLRRTMILPEPT